MDKNSRLSGRVIDYGGLVDKYTVIVPALEDKEVTLSDKVRVYGRGGGNKITRFFRVFSLAKRLLRKGDYTLITVQDQYYLALIAWRLAAKFKVGLEIQVHGFEKFSGLRKAIAKFVIPKADAIRTVSQRLCRQLVDDFKVAENKITVVPIYGEPEFSILDNKMNKKNGEFVFLSVSRLVKVKNIGMMIKAIASDKFKKANIKLKIVGEGSERKKLESISKKLGVEDRVEFMGRRYDMGVIYGDADTFLLTSNAEGWGLVVVEAASFGLPIIMTDVGCAGEVIKDGESGIVIPVGGQKELEEAMRKIIGDRDLREKLGSNAKKALEKLPSKEETLKLYKESWERVVNNTNVATDKDISYKPIYKTVFIFILFSAIFLILFLGAKKMQELMIISLGYGILIIIFILFVVCLFFLLLYKKFLLTTNVILIILAVLALLIAPFLHFYSEYINNKSAIISLQDNSIKNHYFAINIINDLKNLPGANDGSGAKSVDFENTLDNSQYIKYESIINNKCFAVKMNYFSLIEIINVINEKNKKIRDIAFQGFNNNTSFIAEQQLELSNHAEKACENLSIVTLYNYYKFPFLFNNKFYNMGGIIKIIKKNCEMNFCNLKNEFPECNIDKDNFFKKLKLNEINNK